MVRCCTDGALSAAIAIFTCLLFPRFCPRSSASFGLPVYRLHVCGLNILFPCSHLRVRCRRARVAHRTRAAATPPGILQAYTARLLATVRGSRSVTFVSPDTGSALRYILLLPPAAIRVTVCVLFTPCVYALGLRDVHR
jgi:hypothetical protein